MAGVFGNLNENQVLQILCYLAPADAISMTQTSKNEMFAPKKALMEGYFEHCTRRIFVLSKLEAADGAVTGAANGYPAVGAPAVTSWYEAFQSWHQARYRFCFVDFSMERPAHGSSPRTGGPLFPYRCFAGRFCTNPHGESAPAL
ncbi:unnamed protein product [Cladocopium goreaui]|uniref:Uncharacterized protein n=1 Tax=Cladocopium goreaui TaxID=2562237 RepID=A0A9P1CKG6_9DINO|nr:unnamed protein product [Cladocopium goreaui]